MVLERISKDRAAALENLFQLYAHDFSEHVPLELQPDGRFSVSVGEAWWTAADHHPFLLRSSDNLIGFALVRRGSRITGAADVMDMAEFFVVRGARRQKLGTRAAHALFGAFPGAWELRVRPSNVGALSFWSRAAEAWTGESARPTSVSIEGVDWSVIRIAAGGGARRTP